MIFRYSEIETVRLTDHRVRRHLLGGGRGRRRSVRQKVAQRQGRRDDLPLLLEVEVIQTVAALRRRHDRHRLRRRVVMVVVVMVLLLMVQSAVQALVVAAVVGGARAGGHQVDATHAYGHRARVLAATPSLPAPRAEDRYESRQRSYRVVPVNAARITCSRARRQRLASSSSSLTTSRSRLHGSTVRFARLPRDNDPRGTLEIAATVVVLDELSAITDHQSPHLIVARRKEPRDFVFRRSTCELALITHRNLSSVVYCVYRTDDALVIARSIADVEPIITFQAERSPSWCGKRLRYSISRLWHAAL